MLRVPQKILAVMEESCSLGHKQVWRDIKTVEIMGPKLSVKGNGAKIREIVSLVNWWRG